MLKITLLLYLGFNPSHVKSYIPELTLLCLCFRMFITRSRCWLYWKLHKYVLWYIWTDVLISEWITRDRVFCEIVSIDIYRLTTLSKSTSK